jgi:hypothetical protein
LAPWYVPLEVHDLEDEDVLAPPMQSASFPYEPFEVHVCLFDEDPRGEGEGAGVPEAAAQHPDLLEQAQERLKAAKASIERAQMAQKRYYDRVHRPPDDIQEGDSVFLLLDLFRRPN